MMKQLVYCTLITVSICSCQKSSGLNADSDSVSDMTDDTASVTDPTDSTNTGDSASASVTDDTETDTPSTPAGTDSGEFDDTDTTPLPEPVEMAWITIPGGTFNMGAECGGAKSCSTVPIHSVTLPSFEMLKAEVTVHQYRTCVDAGVCTAPVLHSNDMGDDDVCVEGHARMLPWLLGNRYVNHPMSCVTWVQAQAFCVWAGGRLPSESEWEYAAKSAGADIKYPWGNEAPNCSLAIFASPEFPVPVSGGGIFSGCGEEQSWPVCSVPKGNTVQGLCNMAGNISEWVTDPYHSNYIDAPDDGTTWSSTEESEVRRVTRGSSYTTDLTVSITSRGVGDENTVSLLELGFRCAR